MRPQQTIAFVLVAALSACSSGSTGSVPAPSTGSYSVGLAISPQPLLLDDGQPFDSITVSGDTAGVSYTPTTDPSCATADGAIAVSGNGDAQLDQAGVPLMFLVYAVGTPPATCNVTITGSDGTSGSVQATYQVVPIITTAAVRAIPLAVMPGVVSPTSATISAANQLVPIAVSGFSGTVSATVASGCTSGSGIQVTPSSLSGGAGTFTVVVFGQGQISKSCSIDIADSANAHATVPILVSVGALHKFTVKPSSVQFGCAGSSAPLACQTTQAVTLSEVGAQSFSIVTRPGYHSSCANAFQGPLTMTTGTGTYAQSVAGPTADVAFNGLLPGSTLGCSTIILTDNQSPAQRVTINVNPTIAAAPATVTAAVAPPCTGSDAHVAVPGAPHGMYVWNPYTVDGGIYESQLESSVIGKDPTLCGVSLVIRWSDVEPSKGSFDWSEIDTGNAATASYAPNGLAAPYVNAGLTVNLLFEDGPERGPNNPVTPAWVTASDGDNVPVVKCDSQPPAPDYMDPTFEKDWAAFIAAAVQHYSNANSAMAEHIGYMRFAIGFGVEAIPAHFDDGEHADCLAKWEAAPVNFTYAGWVQHGKNVVNAIGAQSTDKQMMVALNGLDGGATIYDFPNAVAEDAANKGIGFGTENLGIANVALPTSTPAACDPQAKIVNLYWCQAFTRHVGEVPFEFQTDVASTAPQAGESPIDLGKALQYGMDNNAQIFELYPQEWLAANVAGFTTPTDQTAHQQALNDASLVLGGHKL
jgi:hypothetical protein